MHVADDGASGGDLANSRVFTVLRLLATSSYHNYNAAMYVHVTCTRMAAPETKSAQYQSENNSVMHAE